MPQKPDDRSEMPDALSPEWTEYESAWAVNVSDFPDLLEAARFVSRRRRIFREAQALGISKEMLTPFEPNLPGFEERVRVAFSRIIDAAGLAAE